ncbi:MAG: four helix bundle protein [Polyangiales bacterium]
MKKTKTPPFGSNNFRALDAAYSLISALAPVVVAVGRHDRSLRDQLRRAGSSIPLNLAEGYGQAGGHEKQRFLAALGSAREVAAILEVAKRWGYVSSADADEALQTLDGVTAMTYRLVHPRTRR